METIDLPSNPSDNAKASIIGSTLSLTILALSVVCARIWIRATVVKNLGWDDALMVLSMVGTLATEGVILTEVHFGHGRHIGDVPPVDYATGMMLNYITQPMVFVFTNLVKLSVGAALLRIANKGAYKWIVVSVMGFTVFYTCGAFITIIIQCRPISLNWDQTAANLARGSCWPPETAQALAYTAVALSIITDLLFALGIPIPMLFRLQMNRKTKIALLGVFSLGSLACVAAIVRLGYLTSYGVRDDWLWDSRKLTVWTMVEVNFGIIAGSMPACKPMFRRIIDTTQRYASRDKTPHGTSYGASASKGSFWRSLGSRSVTEPDLLAYDDVSSQRAINVAGSSYVMQDFGSKDRNAVITTVDASRSDSSEELGEAAPPVGSPPDGITKTTTTTLSYRQS